MLASGLVNTLGQVVIRAELDDLKKQIPLDSSAKVTSEPQGDVIRWFWKGLVDAADEMSIRVTLGCQGEAVVRAKVRGYYHKGFASKAGKRSGNKNRQEIYTGQTRKFIVNTDSEVTFSVWLKDELQKCTTLLQGST